MKSIFHLAVFWNILCNHLGGYRRVLAVLILALAFFPTRASAAAISVNTATNTRANDGYCSLVEAIIAANTDTASGSKPGECPAGSGADMILLAATTYTLSSANNSLNGSNGLPSITSDITIQGNGALIERKNSAKVAKFRLFHVSSGGALTLVNVTLQNGYAYGISGDGGGAIYNKGALAVNGGSKILSNSASGSGGGIYNNNGTLSIDSSTVAGNSAGDGGGGVYLTGGRTSLTNDAIYGNSAGPAYKVLNRFGGGIKNVGNSLLTVTNSTISGNTAADDGAGIYNNTATITLASATITLNHSFSEAGGIDNFGSVHFLNSIIAGNLANQTNPDCRSLYGWPLLSDGYNLTGSGTGCPQAGPGDLTVDPASVFSSVLGPLQDNGGPTFTHALLPASPALDAGSPDVPGSGGTACPATDQRGVLRPQASRCDTGAFEFENPLQTGPVFLVNKTADSADGACGIDDCSLREAIIAANSRPGPDTILLPSGNYALTINGPGDSGGDLNVSDALTLQGDGEAASTIDAGALGDRIFDIRAGAAISGVLISGGNSANGGGIAVIHANLSLVNSTVRANSAALGGGIFLDAAGLTLTGSKIESNSASQNGAGIYAGPGSNLTIDASAIQDNHAAGTGGGIYNQGALVITASTLSANTANTAGGLALISGKATIQGDSIFANSPLGIDLGGDGVTSNDAGDGDGGPNDLQNFPVLSRAIPQASAIAISGRLNSLANTTYTLEFFSSTTCDPSGYGQGESLLGSAALTTDANGDAIFDLPIGASLPLDVFVTATATDSNGNTSEFSSCIPTSVDNDSWPRALELNLSGSPGTLNAQADQYIDSLGQSRWYKFKVQPNSKVLLTLTNLAANYDLTLYKDIANAYQTLLQPQDLVRLSAEFAPDAFSPSAFSPSAFSPSAFSPSAFSPSAFSPSAFSPSAFSPSAFSPSAFSPSAFSPSAFSPSAFSPSAFSPSAFSPSAFSPSAFSPSAFSPSAFSSAQTRSLIGISAFDGIANEELIADTWTNAGDFYVRVTGRNGDYSLQSPFHLEATLFSGTCGSVSPVAGPSTISPSANGIQTVILTDINRMSGTAAEKSALQAKLAAFAARPDVKGVVVDVESDQKVRDLNTQADANPDCPYAENLLAGAIKDIVDGYWALNPLQYVAIVGNDEVIPFFRYPDTTLLGNETDYVPPVRDETSSQASLRLGYVLTQDPYGSRLDISIKSDQFPIPELAVGRLVESPLDVSGMIDAYMQTPNGVVPTPSSALVSGYDFLQDAALAVQGELQAGMGVPADTLIASRDLSPSDPLSWTADDLRQALLGSRHDLIFLAGHFSANSALAADYSTSLLTTELLASNVDLTNAIIFSAGCHAGYNIVNEHGVPGVTLLLDWPQAFAEKKATLIAGTGYQYGDTDFLEYSERIYAEFSRQLRVGSGPVPVGKALVASKQVYLSQTAQVRGLHEKALLEATLFGLPMLSVNMPAGRITNASEPSVIPSLNTFNPGQEPGYTLGLAYADYHLTPSLIANTLSLKNVEDDSLITATYLSGTNGIVTNPAEPALPLERRNVSFPSEVLRGVGFRGGNYTDIPNVIPLTGAPTSEIRGVHAPFFTSVFYPLRTWSVNYFSALTDVSGGATRLMVTPAQHLSSEPGSQTSILRRFDGMDFRLYYSANINTYAGGSVPALAAPPTILAIDGQPASGSVNFQTQVIGNPAAGIQQVWVTYTGFDEPFAGRWQSLDLAQNPQDSTLWEGSLDLQGVSPDSLRFIVQAVNGVGLVSLDDNQGAYFEPGLGAAPPAPPQPSAITLVTPPASSVYGTQASFTAELTSAGSPLAGKLVTFGLGAQTAQAFTDANGRATVVIPFLELPGQYQVSASSAATSDFLPSSTAVPFSISRQPTQLSLSLPPGTVPAGGDLGVVATLSGVNDHPLQQRTVFFVLSGANGSATLPVITDYLGRAFLGKVSLPSGSYSVQVFFGGALQLPEGTLNLDDPRYLPSSASGSIAIDSPPVANAGGPYTAPEGGSVQLDGSLSFDPDPGDTLSFAWDLDGDGSFETNGVSPLFSAVGLNGPSVRSVKLQVCDPFNLCATSTAVVIIQNVSPEVGAIDAPVDPIKVNTSINASAIFTDTGSLDTHTAVWDWGDGSTSPGSVDELAHRIGPDSHVYQKAGVYQIKLTVTDQDGGIGEKVYPFLVVYDPSDGYVTGGGWILSQPGSCQLYPGCMDDKGKAHFGFVAKYKNNALTPIGSIEFEFEPAELELHSTSYDWLVVSGAMVQFKGKGRINHAGNYGFLISAMDADMDPTLTRDLFRIVIWDMDNNDTIVYDSQYGDGLNAGPTTPLGGGNIAIHKGKR